MIGTAIVSLPWAFEKAGIVIGCITSFICYCISFYTCWLIVDSIGDDADYSDTLKKYYGKLGLYTGQIATVALLIGATTSLFGILSQISYALVLAIMTWCTGEQYEFQSKPVFNDFSQAYTALVLFLIVVAVCSKKDLNIFIKMGSFGALFVTTLILFITGTGVMETTKTDYVFGSPKEAAATNWNDDNSERTIMLFNTQFANLAGMLGCGYFLHTCAPNITRTSMYPERNK